MAPKVVHVLLFKTWDRVISHDKGELRLQGELWLWYEFPVAAIVSYHNLVAPNNRNWLSHKYEGQKSKISFTGLKPRWGQSWTSLEALGENLFIASSSFWWLLVFLGLWLHHSNLCLCGHFAFSFMHVISFCLLFVWMLVMAFSGYSDNPGKCLHFMTLNWILSVKSFLP